jgi:transcription-repair coupling factor (superfamily II helicase)
VRELKGEAEAQQVNTQLNLALNLRIPNDYITEENQRLRIYKKIAGAETEQQLADVRAELGDRFGEPPAPVRNLLDASALKMLCQRVGVAGIDRKQNAAHVKFTESAEIDPAKLAQFVASNRGAQFSPGGTLKFVLKSTAADAVIAQLSQVLSQLALLPEGVSLQTAR